MTQDGQEQQPLNALIVKAGEGVQDALPLGDGVFASPGVSNSYLVTTADGDVLINTGMYFEAERIKERFARVGTNMLRTIILTQGHADHVGGWSQLTAPGVETIAQADHANVREYWRTLHSFYAGRSRRLWNRDVTNVDPAYRPPEPVVTTTFLDTHVFTLGGRRFELYATPGGETTDSLVVRLPDEGIVFTGNLTGPLFGHIPNLYTIRGDKYRSAVAFTRSVDRVIGLEPETLITGHGAPIRGAERIRAELTRVRDATRYLRDKTVAGMNAGVDLWTLMAETTLPPELDVPQGHGKVPWIVRSVWEEHAGWFRYESTTELYEVPLTAIGAELVELAGGAGVLVERAEAHLAAGRPLEALHFVELVLARAPGDRGALRTKLGAHKLLLERSGRENFSEVRWLEAEIRDLEEALS
ncbi:MAG: MBL fold metallo-hydrolase [Streptomycetaceae bacterium]|nr:MBL fold metallo-hydrolase [Streptomycetaceae bacterium]